MTLRPGGGPARLLLELWEQEAQGRGAVNVEHHARARLLALGYVRESATLCWLTLTPAGREAAQALQASS